MACPADQAFVDLLDGRLEGDARETLYAHVSACTPCSRLLAALARGACPDSPGDGDQVAHYRLEGVLGRGGMGVVHRAFDLKLRRSVAIKLLAPGLAGDPQARARLEREARASAALEHPHVGGVFEIGQHEGHVFLVMPLFEGGTLKDRLGATPLPKDEALVIIRQLVSGLAAAHRAGVVHRDVKPGNVMLTSSGVRLVDFGLAKLSDASATLSASGQLLGTPAYMAPEQFGGVSDQRTDVWGVGAVAYELLAGRPPFGGDTVAALHVAVTTREPAPLPRDRAPRDLTTIVLACLEKDPARRYPSAVELEEDLERLAQARPVAARRAGAGRWLGRNSRRLRVPLAIGLVALVGVGASAVVMRRSAAERAQRAQEFTRQASELGALMREAHLMPLHDTRPERAQVRARLAAVEHDLARLGPSVAATGHYALGSGYLALGDVERAHRELETAWAAGERSPDAAFLLGYTGSKLYRQALHDARELPSEKERAAREAELKTTLRAPALAHLREGATPDSRDLVEALIAFEEGQFERSLSFAERAFAAAPRRYEAGAAAAEAQSALAAERWRAGDRDQAIVWFDRAAATYRRVTEIARSDDHMYEEAAGQLFDSFNLRRERGGLTDDSLRELIGLWENARKANPDAVGLLRGEADAEWVWSDNAASHGGEWEPHARASLRLAEEALGRDPDDWHTLLTVGLDWQTIADNGNDSTAAAARSIPPLEKAVRLHPNMWTHTVLATALTTVARERIERGADGAEAVEHARREFEAALAISPDDQLVTYNLGDALTLEAWEHTLRGADAGALLDAAAAKLERASELDRSDAQPHERLADVLILRARERLCAGADPARELEQARAEIDAAAHNDPKRIELWRTRAQLEETDVVFRLARHLDPEPALARARTALERLNAGEGGSWGGTRFELVRVELLAARAAFARGGDPEKALSRAGAALQQVNASEPDRLDGWLALAEVHLWRAKTLARAHRSPGAEAVAGLTALEHDAAGARASTAALRAVLLALRARDTPALAHEAQAARQRADAHLLDYYE